MTIKPQNELTGETIVNYFKTIDNNITKICSFNINGIHSFLKKSNMKYLIKEKPDIIAFQETQNARQIKSRNNQNF